MRYIYIITALLILSQSCKNETNNSNVKKDSPKTQQANNSAAVPYPTIPESIINNLASNCDFIDYIFYEIPISLSQDNKDAINSNIKFISKDSPSSNSTICKSMGRKSYQKNGEIIMEADIFINVEEKCFYYIFYENGKKAYANNMTKEAINFYYNVFGQAGIKR